MPWVIERYGAWHSDSGWRATPAAAKRFERIEDAHAEKRRLLETALKDLPGELHIKELSK